MSISVFSVDKLLTPMDYETATAAAANGRRPERSQQRQRSPVLREEEEEMHSGSDTEDTKDSKCSSPVNSHNSESLDMRNSSVSNLSQDILQTMIQSCRRLAERCDCAATNATAAVEDEKRRSVKKCEKCIAGQKFNLNLVSRESFQSPSPDDKCNTIIDEPVKPVLKFSVSAILSGTKSSSNEERLLKSRNSSHGKKMGTGLW